MVRSDRNKPVACTSSEQDGIENNGTVCVFRKCQVTTSAPSIENMTLNPNPGVSAGFQFSKPC